LKPSLPFAVFLIGQFCSRLTSTAVQFAIVWHIALEAHSPLVMATAGICAFLPAGLCGLFTGTIVDRLPKRAVLIVSDLGMGALALTVALLGSVVALPIWAFCIVLALRSVGDAFHGPAVHAIIPLMVQRQRLGNAAGFNQLIGAVPLLAGPSLAALLMALLPFHLVVGTDVIGAVIATGILMLLRIDESQAKRGGTGRSGTGRSGTDHAFLDYWTELKDGWTILRRQRGLFFIVMLALPFFLLLSAPKPLFPLMAIDYFGGTQWHASLVDTGFAVGMTLCSLAVGLWGGMKNRVHAIIVSRLLVAFCMLGGGLLPNNGFVVFVALFTLGGAGSALYNSAATTLIQLSIPQEYLGRVFALYNSIMLLAMPLAMSWGGAVAEFFGPSLVYAISGALMIPAGLVLLLPRSVRALGHRHASADANQSLER
jgi:DHA3 family macrolide efflux protein-like MFS transporter